MLTAQLTAPTSLAGSTEPPPNDPNPNTPPPDSDPQTPPTNNPPYTPPTTNNPTPIGAPQGGNGIGGLIGIILGAIAGAALLALTWKYRSLFFACCYNSSAAYSAPEVGLTETPDGDLGVEISRPEGNSLSVIRNGRNPQDRGALRSGGDSDFMAEIAQREGRVYEHVPNVM